MGEGGSSSSILLSDILKSCREFSFFHELLNLKQLSDNISNGSHKYLVKYDLIQVETTIGDITEYLSSLLQIFHEIHQANITDKNTVTWIFEAKNEITTISKNLTNIDDIISQLLVILETRLLEEDQDHEQEKDHHQQQHPLLKILESFDHVSDLCLKTKKFAIGYKKRLDIAVLYNELEQQVIGGIDTELNECLRQSFKIQEMRLTTPYKESIIDKLKNWDLIKLVNNENYNALPIQTGLDRALYDQYIQLDSKIRPLQMSLEFVPPTLENFRHRAQELYPVLIKSLQIKYDELKEKVKFLTNDVAKLKIELIVSKWEEYFHLVFAKLIILRKDLKEDISSEEVVIVTQGQSFKISMINKTMNMLEKLKRVHEIKLDDNISRQYIDFVEEWTKLNKIFTQAKKESSTKELNEDDQHKILTTIDRGESIYEYLPDFMKKDLMRKKEQQAHHTIASPSKVNRKLMLGNSIANSLGLKPVYLDRTPMSSFTSSLVQNQELDQLRKKKNQVNNKLMDELHKAGGNPVAAQNDEDEFAIADLDQKMNSLKIDSIKTISHKSKIPIPKSRISLPKNKTKPRVQTWQCMPAPLTTIEKQQQQALKQIPRPATSLAITRSSMIPRPVSVLSSRSSSRNSSRSSSSSSADLDNDRNSFDSAPLSNFKIPNTKQQRHRRVVSSSSAASSGSNSTNGSTTSTTRVNLGNITNVTNNHTNSCNNNNNNNQRKSLVPKLRTDIRSTRRPTTSLSCRRVSDSSTTSGEYCY